MIAGMCVCVCVRACVRTCVRVCMHVCSIYIVYRYLPLIFVSVYRY